MTRTASFCRDTAAPTIKKLQENDGMFWWCSSPTAVATATAVIIPGRSEIYDAAAVSAVQPVLGGNGMTYDIVRHIYIYMIQASTAV